MRSAVLRSDFASHALAWVPLFDVADRGYSALHWVRSHPALPVAGMVALLVARPRGVVRWIRRGWFAWQALGKLRVFLLAKQTGIR